MHSDFWLERWSSGRTGFHQSSVEPFLRDHWHDLDLEAGSRVFVPLCGKTLDLLWIAELGHEVLANELSGIATEAFFSENGIPARRRATPPFDRYEAPSLVFLRGDFFDLTAAMVGDAVAVYDRAALISWAPDLRSGYAQHLMAITPNVTVVFLIVLEYGGPERRGPPFSVDLDEITRLFSGHFCIRELARRGVVSRESELLAKGFVSMVEICYQLTQKHGP